MKYLIILVILMLSIACSDKDGKTVYVDSMSATTTPEKYSNVTAEFGALSFQEGEFTGKTKITPWSSWWFPSKDRYLFESANTNDLAPLEKYDLYIEKAFGKSPESAFFEEMEIYDPSEVNWAGLCHAWAIASVLHVEPRSAIMRKDIKLNVSDQKALILKTYENVSDLKIYGSRNNGSFNDEFDDVYPDQFHRLSQIYLFDKHLPFLMDYDPSFPVWTVPVSNIKFKIAKLDEVSAHVKAWVTIASPLVDSPDFVGTKKTVKYYEYKLIGYWEGATLRVSGSEWINDSVYDHPDFLIAYPENVKRASLNKKLDIVKIDELLGLKYVEKY